MSDRRFLDNRQRSCFSVIASNKAAAAAGMGPRIPDLGGKHQGLGTSMIGNSESTRYIAVIVKPDTAAA